MSVRWGFLKVAPGGNVTFRSNAFASKLAFWAFRYFLSILFYILIKSQLSSWEKKNEIKKQMKLFEGCARWNVTFKSNAFASKLAFWTFRYFLNILLYILTKSRLSLWKVRARSRIRWLPALQLSGPGPKKKNIITTLLSTIQTSW